MNKSEHLLKICEAASNMSYKAISKKMRDAVIKATGMTYDEAREFTEGGSGQYYKSAMKKAVAKGFPEGDDPTKWWEGLGVSKAEFNYLLDAMDGIHENYKIQLQDTGRYAKDALKRHLDDPQHEAKYTDHGNGTYTIHSQTKDGEVKMFNNHDVKEI